jgi:hypothetical protein
VHFKQGKNMPTPGELLARKLSGDTSVTNLDIATATDKFFSSHGVEVHCEITERILNVEGKSDQVISIDKKELDA